MTRARTQALAALELAGAVRAILANRHNRTAEERLEALRQAYDQAGCPGEPGWVRRAWASGQHTEVTR